MKDSHHLIAMFGAFLIGVAVGGCLCEQQVRGQELRVRGLVGNVTPSAGELELGRQLFFDPRISADNTVSCSTCHDPKRGWTDSRPQAVGILGQRGTRNTPTVLNATYADLQFWDGRAVGLATQAGLPMLNPIEMGNVSEAAVVAKISLIPGYVVQFTKVYGLDGQGRSVTMVNMSRALSAFESMVVSAQDAPIDKRLRGDKKALSADAEIGFQIFTKANCVSCHKPPLFGNPASFANNGMEYAGKGVITDQGRAEFTQLVADRRKFKVPSLREIQRTAPYNHAGTFPDLERVVAHYSAGGAILVNGKPFVDATIDPRVAKRLDLTASQQKYLVEFLKTAFASPSYPEIEPPRLP